MLPKKGSRKIQVENENYRWKADIYYVIITGENKNIRFRYSNNEHHSIVILPSHVAKIIKLYNKGEIEGKTIEDIL